ncbi:cyclin-like protein [Lipomyces tetrasporus]|uniref:Cyclin-like protein n=1 Tax=Lipomyces tetrasporus TaxID=54092 RepID=A0AAD7R154_9ASCO|nr:cyclin-like protein [Lipomyces tetrasporus]KAJ8103862.1 cyclin-like protein [Lipomyces tetrasporus]
MERKLRQPVRVRPDENAVVSRQSSRVQLKQSSVFGDAVPGSYQNEKNGLKAGAKRVVLGDVSNAIKSTSTGLGAGKLVQPAQKSHGLVSKASKTSVVPSQHHQSNSSTTSISQNASYFDSSLNNSVHNYQEEGYHHHVDAADVAEVYRRVRQSKERANAEPADTKAVEAEQQTDVEALANVSEHVESVDDKDGEMRDDSILTTKDIYNNSTTGILHNLDSTDYTNIHSTTNPSALFPVINDETRREFDALASRFRKEERARTLSPDYEADEDLYDVSMVAEYSDEIFEYMRELELRFRPNPAYMDNQTEIHWSMRCILVDWLVQVHNRFGLLPETLYLTINYIDRFLSLKVVSLAKLQLVGATALFVAAKYEEINCPSVNEIVFMVDHSYSVEEIFKAERFMIGLLEFNLGWPGPMSFLRRTSKADDYDLETRTLAKYILEITVMDERFVGALPSWLAAAAHCLARKMLLKGDWTLAHVNYSGYTLAQLRPVMNVLIECCRNPKEHHRAIYEKYCDRKYKKAALYVAEWISNATI